jgi:hypothetical protein
MKNKREKKICSESGCDRYVSGRGLCTMHLKRVWRKEPGKLCGIEGCNKKHEAKGFCSRHYQKFHDFGDPLSGRDTFNGEPMKWLMMHVAYDGEGCLEWPFGKMTTGYGSIAPLEKGKGKNTCSHIIMCQEAHGYKPSVRHQVAHSCGNRGCVNPRHLRWATQSENEADKEIHGRLNYARGEAIGNAKLKSEDVLRIVKDARSGSQIAKEYGVDKTTILNIKRGRTWRWLTGRSAGGGLGSTGVINGRLFHGDSSRCCTL